MSTHLITGFAGKEHITSADQGSFNAAVMGGGEFALERGEQFRCQVISNNKVRIYDGDAMMQGRHIIIDRNTYEETTHDNGTQGYKRIDLIVLTYEKNAASSVETVKLEVIKGLPSESDPVVPEYTKGDILNSGASKNQMPLYQIPFDGLSIGEPVKLFSTVPTLETMKKEVDDEVDAKKEELDDKFKSMIASNATDWGMIGNYGEFTADAKTVGEEFSKVNDSLSKKTTFTFTPNENINSSSTLQILCKNGVYYVNAQIACAFTSIEAYKSVQIGKINNWVGTGRTICPMTRLGTLEQMTTLLLKIDGNGNVSFDTHAAVSNVTNVWFYGMTSFIL